MTSRSHVDAFSLIEITVAIGVIAVGLLAILGLLPIGMKSGRDAVDATRTSLIAQDVSNRVRASMTSNDPSSQFYFGAYQPNTASFFFYTADGARTGELLHVQYPNDAPEFYKDVTTPNDFYRVKVVVGVFDQSIYTNISDPRHVPPGATPSLLAAQLEIAWPISTQDGSVISAATNKAKFQCAFFVRKP
jgi:uncharacterized protein (TIGR02598 family)